MNIQCGQRMFQIILAIRETDLMKRMVDETRVSSPVFLQMQIVLSCAKGIYHCVFGGTITIATKTIILPLAGSHVDSWQLLQKNDFVLSPVCILVKLSRIYRGFFVNIQHIFLYVRMPFVSEK